MDGQTVLYGIAAVLAVMIASRSKEEEPAFLAVLLLSSWAVTVLAWIYNALESLPIMDGAIAMLGLAIWRSKPSDTWRLAFVYCAIVQLLLDVAYERLGVAYYQWYSATYNVSFVGELVAVSWPGGVDGLRRLHRFLLLRRVLASQRVA